MAGGLRRWTCRADHVRPVVVCGIRKMRAFMYSHLVAASVMGIVGLIPELALHVLRNLCHLSREDAWSGVATQ